MIPVRSRDQADHDVNKTLTVFKEMQGNNPEFTYRVQGDEERRIKRDTSRAEDVLPPLPPSNSVAFVRSPSTSERPPSRSSKNEGLQEKSLIKILTKVFPSELWKRSNANDLKKFQLHML